MTNEELHLLPVDPSASLDAEAEQRFRAARADRVAEVEARLKERGTGQLPAADGHMDWTMENVGQLYPSPGGAAHLGDAVRATLLACAKYPDWAATQAGRLAEADARWVYGPSPFVLEGDERGLLGFIADALANEARQ